MSFDAPFIRIDSSYSTNPPQSPSPRPAMEKPQARQPYLAMRRRGADPYSPNNGYEKSPFSSNSGRKGAPTRSVSRLLLLIVLVVACIFVANSWGIWSYGNAKSGAGLDALRADLEKEYKSRIEDLENTIKRQNDHIVSLATAPKQEVQPNQPLEPTTPEIAEDVIETPTLAQPPTEPSPPVETKVIKEEQADVGLERAKNSANSKVGPAGSDPKIKLATDPVASEVVRGQQEQKHKMEAEAKLVKQQNDMLRQSNQAPDGNPKAGQQEGSVAHNGDTAAKGDGDKAKGAQAEAVHPENHFVETSSSKNSQHRKSTKKFEAPKPTKPISSYQDVLVFVGYQADRDITADAEMKKEHDKLMRHVDLKDNTPVQIFKTLPSSDVWCYGNDKNNRVCRFRNLCYTPKEDEWFILQTNRTQQHNVPLHRFAGGLLELGTVANHPYFRWNFAEVSPFNPDFQNVAVRYEEQLHFIQKRLHPRNIMHNLHDDVLGMYFMLKEYVGKGSHNLSMPFSLDTHRIFIEGMHGATDSTRPFAFLSKYPIRFGAYIRQDEDVITCFRDAVVGNSKLTTWYQYGFDKPQGPIEDKAVNGMHVREVAEWFVRRLGLPVGEDEDYNRFIDKPQPEPPGNSVDYIGTDLIVILSRKSNRLIINEEELAAHLTKEFGMETKFVRNEDLSFDDQIRVLRRARMVIGMHGSILVMGMFCRRGTVLVEIFPYGVPAGHYTPYKTMANLPGMALIYRALEIQDESNAVAHPNRSELSGGIKHLSPAKQHEITTTRWVPQHLCCTNPFWLYRIYQDTRIPLNEMTDLLNDALQESKALLNAYQTRNWEETDLLPPRVHEIRCLNGEKRKPGELWAEWDLPWNGAKVDQWNIVITNTGREYAGGGDVPMLAIGGFEPGEAIELWVRPIVGKFKGEWGARQVCIV
ncbi:Protein O-linked-mannose beta-1,4-N-acetylglucosaminyltransferase 2 [Rhizophlyctis rosea]|nr:Protein O-linked-mannose beta-1,4-N-acetylglucosaminyltransferase 2 [Rhizophlyctis rosea]